MARWVRSYWDEEDTWFVLELDSEGWVTRQVDLRGPTATPVTAASLSEWCRELDAGRIGEYQATYGVLTEKPIEPAELVEFEEISAAEFERVWQHARRVLGAG
ncbi:MAG: hypothetical protein M3422_15645 [Actinomycetota bacterium]|nr:hypothetical protein [Actinomycetota bacterium]